MSEKDMSASTTEDWCEEEGLGTVCRQAILDPAPPSAKHLVPPIETRKVVLLLQGGGGCGISTEPSAAVLFAG